MNFHAGSSLIIACSTFALSVFVYIMGRRKLPNITLSLLLLSASVWSFGQFMGELTNNASQALLWARIHQGAAIVLPVFFLQFVFAFLGRIKQRKFVLFLSYLYMVAFLGLNFTPLFIKGVSANSFSHAYPVPGTAFPIYTGLYFVFIAYSFYELFSALRNTSGDSQSQIIYVILASLVSMVGGAIIFLPIYGIDILPISYYSIPLFAVLALYAMIRYRLLDIKIVLRRGLVYTLLTLLFSAIYILVIFGMREIFQAVTGINSLVAAGFVVFAFTAFFVPLRDRIQDGVDKVFFKGTYDYQKILKRLSRSITSILDLDMLLNTAVDTISSTMDTKWASVMLKENGKICVRCRTGSGGPKAFEGDSRIINGLSKKKEAINIDGLGAEDIKEELREEGIHVSIPLISKGELIGVLNLGEKKFGQPFSNDDVDLLATLTNQIAVAIENAILHEKVLKRERELFRENKLASLGTVAAGMAHEIKNPLASVKGMTQILPENLEDKEFIGKYMNIIPRQIDRISSIVDDLLSFGRPRKLEKTMCSINEVVEDVLALVETQCFRKRIEVKKDLDELPKLMLDRDQINQSILNIVLNSIDSMQDGGILTISTSADRENILIEICDTGCGISRDNLSNIFDPFYSSKTFGTGMGLAVTYKIIDEHEGKIGVESEVGRGTKFRITLPLLSSVKL